MNSLSWQSYVMAGAVGVAIASYGHFRERRQYSFFADSLWIGLIWFLIVGWHISRAALPQPPFVSHDGPQAPLRRTDDQNSLSRVFDSVVASSDLIGPPSPAGFETGARIVVDWAWQYQRAKPVGRVGPETEELLTHLECYRRLLTR